MDDSVASQREGVVFSVLTATPERLGQGAAASMPGSAPHLASSDPPTSMSKAPSAVAGRWHSGEALSIDRRLWRLIALCVVLYALASFGRLMPFKPLQILFFASITAVLLAISLFYTVRRPDGRVARLSRGIAELVLLAFLTGALSYAAAALDRPLADAMLDAWDRSLGFHWREWLAVLDAHPHVNALFLIAYDTMIPQLMLAVAALVTVRAYRTLDTYLLAFGVSALVAVVVSGAMPAVSPLVYYVVLPSDHPHIALAVPMEFAAHVRALRAGTMHMIDLDGAQGLVTFPSFHSTCAVLLLLAFWRVPYVRWVSLVLNSLMLLAVPLEGSHYLVDLIAGVALALGSWHLARLTAPRACQD